VLPHRERYEPILTRKLHLLYGSRYIFFVDMFVSPLLGKRLFPMKESLFHRKGHETNVLG
jgi:hypothetical protein